MNTSNSEQCNIYPFGFELCRCLQFCLDFGEASFHLKTIHSFWSRVPTNEFRSDVFDKSVNNVLNTFI